ncbi:MAG: serine/threonine-protein kinase [Gemmatimonadales bacterium]
MTEIDARLSAALADRYRLERGIGEGGMATVYLAEDLKHKRKVAVKVLHAELGGSLGPERFLREIDIAAQFHHPHILPLYDSGQAGGFLYYVMPYVEGESLRARMTREGQLPVDDAVRIGAEVADGLSYAHSRGVVHRDIKPENIMLSGDHALIVDFGVGRAVSQLGGKRLTRSGMVVGTVEYMSPEQASGEKIDGRSDLYSLGCVMYEMLGGVPPHTGPTAQAVLTKKLTDEVPSLADVRSTVGPELDAILRKSLARAPADRFSTAYDFRQVLEGLSTGVPVTRPTVAIRRPRNWRRIATGAGVTLAVALAAVVVRTAVVRSPAAVDGVGLAVFPFRANSDEGLQWSEQLPDLLATILDGTPGVRVADPWALWGSLRPDRGARAVSPTDPEEAASLARRARANRFVLGSLTAEAGTFNLAVRLYRVGSSDPLRVVALVGSVDSIGALVQRLAVDIITNVWRRDSAPSVPELDRYATGSAGALKAYLHAKEAMRRGLVDEADQAIDTALALDTTFALAMTDAITIKSWAASMRGGFFSFMELAERADEYGASLSERNRLRVKSMLASVRTDGKAAAEAAARILEIDSTDFDAWTKLVYYHTVYGWQYGSDERDAIVASDRALQLDSTHVPNLVFRATLALAVESPEIADRYNDLLGRADTTNVLVRGARLAYRSLRVSDDGFTGLADTIANYTPLEWRPILRVLRRDRPDRHEFLLARLLAKRGVGVPRDAIRYEQARMAAAVGSLRELYATVTPRAGPPDWGQTRVKWLLVAPAIAGVGDREIADSIVTDLQAYIPADSALAYFNQRPVWWNGWIVGAYHATYGDTAVAHRWQEAFATLPGEETFDDYRAALSNDLEARMLARRDDYAAALAAATKAHDQWGIHTENQVETHPEPAMRFHYAMLLSATGQPDSAINILRSLVPPTTWLGFYTARASFELGQLLETRGDRMAAARHYANALRYWERGGPEIEVWRAQARDGIERTVGEVGRR